jgi:transposase
MLALPPSWRCGTAGFGGSLPSITPRFCACWRIATTTSRVCAPKPSVGCTPCCASSPRAAPPGALSAQRAGQILHGIHPLEPVATERKRIALDLLGDVRRFDSQLVTLNERITEAVLASGTTVTDVHGIGALGAAIVVGHSGDITRFPDAGHFARYNATAPIAASSALKHRHRLNPRGNRQLNRAIHVAAVTQIAHDTDGRIYFRRKLAEGKTRKEALRALKRQISNAVYRQLIADTRH